ncbi:MAG: hypothetical protein EXR64_03965 [Dehalococcoidia bacterium]|nr:hypothetical protein [Dehalococcoidia bacterium]
MPAAPGGPLAPDLEVEVAKYLGERLVRPVGLDVWTRPDSALVLTDRDPSTHGEQVLATMRQLVRLHPGITVTPYDLDKHATRAAEAGVELSPTTIVRSGGRSVHLVGLPAAMLFPAFLDVLGFLSRGEAPLSEESHAAIGALTAPVQIELLGAAYDPYSAHMMRLVAALAAVSRFVRARIIEVAEFPLLAARRGVTEVPVLTIEGRRLVGAWEEPALIEQIQRVVAGNADPVIRDHVYSMPYVTEAESRRIAAEQASAAPPPPAGGLYIPGR